MVSTNKHSEEKAKLSKWSSWKTKVQYFTESIDHYVQYIALIIHFLLPIFHLVLKHGANKKNQ